MTPPAGARRLVPLRDGRVVEQTMHPCGRWVPDVEDTVDPLAAARGIRTALAALALVAVVWAVLWATVHSPMVMGGLVFAVAIFATVATSRKQANQ